MIPTPEFNEMIIQANVETVVQHLKEVMPRLLNARWLSKETFTRIMDTYLAETNSPQYPDISNGGYSEHQIATLKRVITERALRDAGIE